MFFFSPNVKKMSAAHDIRGLLNILELPNSNGRNIQLRIDAVDALIDFCHLRVLEALIQIISNENENPKVRSRANTVFENLARPTFTITYGDTVNWWNKNKDDPKLIENLRTRERFTALTEIDTATRRLFRPPPDIEAKVYQQTHDGTIEYDEVIEWRNRTRPLIEARKQAERTRLEAIWREENLIWERDEALLNQTRDVR